MFNLLKSVVKLSSISYQVFVREQQEMFNFIKFYCIRCGKCITDKLMAPLLSEQKAATHNDVACHNMHTCCDGVAKASISFPTIGFTLRSSRSKCLAREPIRITTDCRTASKLPESGALSRNSSKTGRRLFTVSCNKIGT